LEIGKLKKIVPNTIVCFRMQPLESTHKVRTFHNILMTGIQTIDSTDHMFLAKTTDRLSVAAI